MPSLEVTEEPLGEGVHGLALAGELDVDAAPAFQRQLNAAVAEHPCVVLDFGRLTFIDSAGMRVLLGALRRTGVRESCVAIACSNPTVLRLFAVTGMDRTFTLRPTLPEAVAAIRGSGPGPGLASAY